MFWINCKEKQPVAFKQWIAAAGSILLGYLAIMGPWMLRNQLVSGHVLSSSGLKGLWILNYDEIFSYPASQLTFRHWLSGGLQTAIHTRVEALLAVLKTGIGVQGEIFLLPFSLIAMWIHRHDPRIRIGAAAWISILIVMVLVFPFAGSRGGFLHSGTAAQIYLWALAPMGLERVVAWGSGKRGWDPQQANQFFQFGMVIIVVLVTGLITQSLVIGQNLSSPVWNQGWDEVVLIESDLHSLGVNPAAVMMVNNPPGYTVATGRRTIVIPDANIEKILEAAHRYGANYLLIQANHPHGLDDLYLHPRSGLALEFLGTIQSGQIFRIGNE